MRLFDSLGTAILEIGRDLSKAPVFETETVHNVETPGRRMHEAQDYSYTMLPQAFPGTAEDLVTLAQANFPMLKGASTALLRTWLMNQLSERTNQWAARDAIARPADLNHPFLKDFVEGSAYSYIYAERLLGAVEMAAEHLVNRPTTRRCFVPIFQPQDFIRAGALTRIPCSIGYNFQIRRVDDVPHLHMTYLSRSCDYDRFWITDIWLAHRFQLCVLEKVKTLVTPYSDPESKLDGLVMGHTAHHVLSFHRFIEADSGEIY